MVLTHCTWLPNRGVSHHVWWWAGGWWQGGCVGPKRLPKQYHRSICHFCIESSLPTSERGQRRHTALPRIRPAGTEPKVRESVELRALSPSSQTCPFGTWNVENGGYILMREFFYKSKVLTSI